MAHQSVFADLLEEYDDIVEDWTICPNKIECRMISYIDATEEKQHRLHDMITRLSMVMRKYKLPKKICIGGKGVYDKVRCFREYYPYCLT